MAKGIQKKRAIFDGIPCEYFSWVTAGSRWFCFDKDFRKGYFRATKQAAYEAAKAGHCLQVSITNYTLQLTTEWGATIAMYDIGATNWSGRDAYDVSSEEAFQALRRDVKNSISLYEQGAVKQLKKAREKVRA